ncbi:hypothetical protein T10_3218 [Trichinella papuae]|uniref:Uncharacterized protein n=1 Tax=Trichinella papuae TaxID=268474 RepID=A0A0V1M6P3_9BILA|nr:hypothetical protein T10_3218 [Trichinella papuae]
MHLIHSDKKAFTFCRRDVDCAHRRRVPVEVQHLEQQQHRCTQARLIAVGTGRPELNCRRRYAAQIFQKWIQKGSFVQQLLHPGQSYTIAFDKTVNSALLNEFKHVIVSLPFCIFFTRPTRTSIGTTNHQFQHASSEAGERDAHVSAPLFLDRG